MFINLVSIIVLPKTRVILLNWCAWLLRMKRPGEDRVPSAGHGKTQRSSLSSMELSPGASQSTSGVRCLENIESSTAATSADSGVFYGRPSEDEKLLPSCASSLGPELAKILDEVRYTAKRLRNEDENKSVCSEWKFAASVIDRLCLVAFSLLTMLCSIGILMSAPNIR